MEKLTQKTLINSYTSKRWVITPVEGKKAILPEWQNKVLTEEEINTYFFNGRTYNIGVVLGKLSGNLVDVDLDSKDAIKIAEYFLPDTIKFGRPSKPCSHWIYTSNVAKTEQYKNGGCIVELRSNGGQTVFPGSIHTSGEEIKWACDITNLKPTEIEPEELSRCVRLLASAVLISRNWTEGIRQDLSLALSGAMLQNGYSKDEVNNFIEAICYLVGDNNTAERLTAVISTAKTIESGSPVTGFNKIKELIGDTVDGQLKRWVNLKTIKPSRIEKENVAVSSDSETRKTVSAEEVYEILSKELQFKTDRVRLFVLSENGKWADVEDENGKGYIYSYLYEKIHQLVQDNNLTRALKLIKHKATQFNDVIPRRTTKFENYNYYNAGKYCIKWDSKGWQKIEHNGLFVDEIIHKEQANICDSDGKNNLLKLLQGLLPCKSQEDLLLLAVRLVTLFIPGIQNPACFLCGPEGSGKTTTSKIIKEIFDPTISMTATGRERDEDIAILFSRNEFYIFDNLSTISQYLSDLLCVIITGGNLSRRQLYSDTGLTILKLKGSFDITSVGINEISPDLRDRGIKVDLRRIDGTYRKTEEELWRDFHSKLPHILASIFNTLVKAAKIYEGGITEKSPIRLCDWFFWGLCIAEVWNKKEEFKEIIILQKDLKTHESISQYGEEGEVILGFFQQNLIENKIITYSATEWARVLCGYAVSKGININFTNRSVGVIFTKISAALAEMGYDIKKVKTSTCREWAVQRCGAGGAQ